MSRTRSFLAVLAVVAPLAACKKTESTSKSDHTAAKPATEPSAPAGGAEPGAAPAAKVAPTAPAGGGGGGGATTKYTNAEPAFTIQVPEGFVANEPMQTGAGNTSIRLAKEGEHSGIGTFVNVTWWEKKDGLYARLRTQAADKAKAGKLEERAIGGDKGMFFYFNSTASRMVDGELKDAKQYVGSSVLEGGDFVLTCTVDSFDEPPAPAFIRACETLALP